MRLLSLDLERVGPFTGTRLVFRPDAALHVVHGSNEAGKTSALEALSSLLFGFEPQTAAAFRHDYAELRVGAEILLPNRGRLHVRRRKGTRNTLVDGADAPLGDGLLQELLGGVTREVFRSAFGLTQAGLRAGADAMLREGGSVGETLFAAASGLRQVVGARKALEGEAETLFAPRKAGHRLFYQALDAYNQARGELRDRALRAETVRTLDAGLDRAEAEVRTCQAALLATAERRARLARLRRAAPVLRRVDAVDADREALGALPETTRDFARRAAAAVERTSRAAEALALAEHEAAAGRLALAGIAVDKALLAQAPAILALADERATVDKAASDLPRRRDEARSAVERLADLARRLGLGDRATQDRAAQDRAAQDRAAQDRAALDRHRPDDAAIAGLRALLEEQAHASAAVQAAADLLARHRSGHGELVAQPGGAAVPDPRPLRRILQAVRPALQAGAGLEEREADLARRRRQLDQRVGALSPAPDREALWRARLPGEAALAGLETEFGAIDAEHRAAAAEARRLQAEIEGLETEVLAAETGSPVPDDTALLAARARRDGLLADCLQGRCPPDLLRAAIAAADALADRRLHEAERVARLQTARRQLAAARRGLERAHARTDEAGRRWRDWQGRVADLFAGFGIAPADLAATRAWMQEAQALRAEREAIAALEPVVEAAARALAAERPVLDGLARTLGLVDPGLRSPFTLEREIEPRLAEIEEAHRSARSRAEAMARSAVQVEAAAAGLAEAEARAEALSGALKAGAASLGLAQDASPASIGAALDVWIVVPGALHQVRDLEHRIQAMEDDAAGFAERARALAERLAGDGGSAPADRDDTPTPSALAQTLLDRLNAAQAAAARRQAEAERLDAVERRLAGLVDEVRQAQSDVEVLAREGGTEPSGLAGLADRLERATTLDGERAALLRDLSEAGDGQPEPALRQDMAGLAPALPPGGAEAPQPPAPYDGVAAAAEEQRLAAEAATLQEFDKTASQTLRDMRRDRAALEQASGAADAAQRMQNAAADLERIARDYLVASTAAAMIEAGIDRQRAERQDPMLRRAGALLAGLTADGFAGLAVDYDDADEPRLAALRRDGARVPIEGLSEGTRDQLYLALRLASLEGFAGGRSTPPFVGDDLLMTFDDHRLGRAIGVLAGLDGLQVILFTHHGHVVDIARRELGTRVDILHLS